VTVIYVILVFIVCLITPIAAFYAVMFMDHYYLMLEQRLRYQNLKDIKFRKAAARYIIHDQNLKDKEHV